MELGVPHQVGPVRAVVTAAAGPVPVAAEDAEVEVVGVGGGIPRLVEDHRCQADDLAGLADLAGVFQERSPDGGRDEEPLDHGVLALEQGLDEAPVAVDVEGVAARLEVGVEAEHPSGGAVAAPGVEGVEREVDVAAALVGLALGDGSAVGAAHVADFEDGPGEVLGHLVGSLFEEADQGEGAVLGPSLLDGGEEAPGAAREVHLLGVFQAAAVGLAHRGAAGGAAGVVEPAGEVEVGLVRVDLHRGRLLGLLLLLLLALASPGQGIVAHGAEEEREEEEEEGSHGYRLRSTTRGLPAASGGPTIPSFSMRDMSTAALL